MSTYLDCIPCVVRQSLDSTRFATSDAEIQERILREVLRAAGDMDWASPPAVLAQSIHRRIRELTGDRDPYAAAKREQNRVAKEYCDHFRQRIEQSDQPLGIAVRLAIAGNVIDLGVKSGLDESEIRSEIAGALDSVLDGELAPFVEAVSAAKQILYLTDNAGEIMFDRLLIEQLPLERVTVAVRGGPVINDATREDAEAAGLADLVAVIDNGSDAPGTILEDCSALFQRHFEQADLIIAKGQGNYESLQTSTRPIYFLLRVKCVVTARDLNSQVGNMVLRSAGQA